MITKFGVDSSSRFPVSVDKQTQLNALPTPAAMPVWVMTSVEHKFSKCVTLTARQQSAIIVTLPRMCTTRHICRQTDEHRK